MVARCVVVTICGAAMFGLLTCGGGEPTPPSGLNEAQTAGWQAYADLVCGSCHGDQREGKRSGPRLAELSDHWTHEELVTYLRDPAPMIKATPRLAYRAEQYPIAMPAYHDKADDATLNALASYLLWDG
jgi:mono/diheme cytochrome c family protein